MDCPMTESGDVAAACLPEDSASQRSDTDCPETESGELAVACPRLPADSLADILSRLHAKPLFRFKCVSKDWCGLITDRLGCRKFPRTLAGFFAGDADGSYGGFIGPPRPVPLVDPSFSFLPKLPESENITLLGSCNGLVLFGHKRVSDSYDKLGYIVCNPATEEWVSVPSSGYTPLEWDSSDSEDEDKLDDAPDTYLIFDPAISPHFQLIQLWLCCELVYLREVHTFSSVTGEWQERQDVLDLTQGYAMVGTGGFSVGCPLNGMLHMSAYQHFLPIENRDFILAIGGEGRQLRTLHWSEKERGSIFFVGQSQGHLHCLSGCMGKDSLMTQLSIWVLEDYNAEKWVLRDNVSFSQLFGRISGRCNADWNVAGIHPDHGLVFFAEYWNCSLISYDMDKKEALALCSLHGYCRRIFPYVPYFAPSAVLTKKQ